MACRSAKIYSADIMMQNIRQNNYKIQIITTFRYSLLNSRSKFLNWPITETCDYMTYAVLNPVAVFESKMRTELLFTTSPIRPTCIACSIWLWLLSFWFLVKMCKLFVLFLSTKANQSMCLCHREHCCICIMIIMIICVSVFSTSTSAVPSPRQEQSTSMLAWRISL